MDQRRSIQPDSRSIRDRNHPAKAMMRQTSSAVPKGAPSRGLGMKSSPNMRWDFRVVASTTTAVVGCYGSGWLVVGTGEHPPYPN